jgi:chorismate-pyruvate lyase
VRYRQVQLVCGTRVLSEADNWYVPALLTPAMNQALDQTDTPFGRVVAPLNFTRRTLSVRNLMGGRAVPSHVLEHRAVLSTGAGAPFSLVVERYTNQVLAH